jgi:hypothetical protein
MIDDIGRAQASAGCAVIITVAVSLLFLIPDMFSAPYFPIGVSLLAVAGLLMCSTLSLRRGVQFWIFPVSLSTTVLLVLVLKWSTDVSQTVSVDVWPTTFAVVRLALLSSAIVAILSVAPIGQKRLRASLSTLASTAAAVICLAIAPLTVSPVPAFWLPAVLGAISLVITTALLTRSEHTLRNSPTSV